MPIGMISPVATRERLRNTTVTSIGNGCKSKVTKGAQMRDILLLEFLVHFYQNP